MNYIIRTRTGKATTMGAYNIVECEDHDADTFKTMHEAIYHLDRFGTEQDKPYSIVPEPNVTKCDGNHAAPACADMNCWHRE